MKSYQPKLLDVKYSVVDKNLHGTKIEKPKTVAKNWIDKEVEKAFGPSAVTYAREKDEPLHEQKPTWTFAKGAMRERTPSPDFKRPIDPSYKLTKKAVPEVGINREHQLPESVIDRELEAMRVGPANYEPEFKLTEQRTTKGNVIFRLPMHPEKVEVPEGPDFVGQDVDDFLKPHKGVPLMMQPTEHQPAHLPDKAEFPERWQFYDVNLNAVREEAAKNVLISGKLSQEEFLRHENFMNLLSEHIRRNQPQPEAGDYDAKELRTQLEYDFGKAPSRFPEVDADELFDHDKEGDVLLLEPEKPQRRLPTVRFDKQVGRTDGDKYVDADNELEEVALTDPVELDKVKKRAPNFVNMLKQVGRQEKVVLDNDEVFVQNFDNQEEPMVPKDPGEKKVVAHDFGKQPERFP